MEELIKTIKQYKGIAINASAVVNIWLKNRWSGLLLDCQSK